MSILKFLRSVIFRTSVDAFVRTSIRTFVDVHQFSFKRQSVPLLMSVSFLWTSISMLIDVNQQLYGCPSVHLWMSISFPMDIHYLC